MTLLRAAARTLLASYFVVSGVKAVKNPAPLVPAAEPLADKFVPMVKQYAPDQVANYIPEDAATLVRLNGAMQLVGGIALASGKGRRIGATLLAASLVPSTFAKHPFWTRETADEKAIDRAHFLKNASLLGGVLLASADTEGKPSLAWRATQGGHSIAKDTRKAGNRVVKNTSALTDAALAEGALLVGAVVKQSRKTQKKAAKDFKRSKGNAKKQALAAGQAAQKAAIQASKDAKAFAKDAQKEGRKQLKMAKKAAARVSKNIQLGEN